MSIVVKEENGFKFVDEGKGQVLLLLHGLFGALSNWEGVVTRFSKNFRVVIPMLPIYEMPIKEAGLEGLRKFVEEFVAFKKLDNLIIMGNSLGGHIGLLYTLKNAEKVKKLILTGSSGLFEDSMGGSYPKRGNYDYIRERVAYTFYDPNVATKELVDEVFETTKSIPKCMRIVAIAKSAQRHNMAEEIPNITAPTLLVWGLNDTITPPMVAHEFNRLIPNSKLKFIDKCCHAPMMEHPEKFNELVEDFLVT
ncbi:alpha/beta hydrolase [Fulvivirgaceae bacterium PWU4]|uniref:Alpha/beta hydrolase n=1 Tax=Chryseosolibacter histidini TaxID=2782349 RepID=A0AAP2DRL8_9BACT|nr:alpha/beta hydrolase [Chryseosolibacter histidini]MBT1700048.1 alpha/beta hydrolase [Chryseosolibacter histidini]